MEFSTELITKIVILATAVVGLYKAATVKEKKIEVDTEGQAKKSAKGGESMFAPLYGLAGVMLFMLAFPAFVYAFTWITSQVPKAIRSPSNVVETAAPSLQSSASTIELSYIAASRIPGERDRGEALAKVATAAVKAKDFKNAIMAASGIPNERDRGEQLKRIVDAIAEPQPAAATPQQP